MKKTLFLTLSLLASAVWAETVAPASVKGKQVNFIYEGAVITDASGNLLGLPTWRSRSVVFDTDNSAKGSRSGTMYYSRLLPATAAIADAGFSGKGYRLKGADGCRGDWMLYFADATHGSAVFRGEEKGKGIEFHNVYFTITEPQAGEPEMGRDRHCTLVPSAEKVNGAPVSLAGKEVVFSPDAQQKAAIGKHVPLDMAFGHCYRGYDSDKLYNPMIATRIPGDKLLSWGTWRDRSAGMSEPMCRPAGQAVIYRRCQDGSGYIGNDGVRFLMSFTSPTEGTASFESDGKKVENIPFTVKSCTRLERAARFEWAWCGLPFGGFGDAKDVRVAWLDSSLAATMRPAPGKPGKVELGVFYDENGDGQWKELSRQTVKLPGSIEDVAPLVFECEGGMHFYDEEIGEVLGKAVDLPSVD